jgi:hypothetical protein
MIGHYYHIDEEILQDLRKGWLFIGEWLDLIDEKGERDKISIDIDKTWHALHFTLCGNDGGSMEDDPLSKVVLNDNILNDEGMGHIVTMYLTVEEVRDIAPALRRISRMCFRGRFSVADMYARHIYPLVCDEDEEAFFDYVYEAFERVVAFFQRAEQDEQAILFIVS